MPTNRIPPFSGTIPTSSASLSQPQTQASPAQTPPEANGRGVPRRIRDATARLLGTRSRNDRVASGASGQDEGGPRLVAEAEPASPPSYRASGGYDSRRLEGDGEPSEALSRMLRRLHSPTFTHKIRAGLPNASVPVGPLAIAIKDIKEHLATTGENHMPALRAVVDQFHRMEERSQHTAIRFINRYLSPETAASNTDRKINISRNVQNLLSQSDGHQRLVPEKVRMNILRTLLVGGDVPLLQLPAVLAMGIDNYLDLRKIPTPESEVELLTCLVQAAKAGMQTESRLPDWAGRQTLREQIERVKNEVLGKLSEMDGRVNGNSWLHRKLLRLGNECLAPVSDPSSIALFSPMQTHSIEGFLRSNPLVLPLTQLGMVETEDVPPQGAEDLPAYSPPAPVVGGPGAT